MELVVMTFIRWPLARTGQMTNKLLCCILRMSKAPWYNAILSPDAWLCCTATTTSRRCTGSAAVSSWRSPSPTSASPWSFTGTVTEGYPTNHLWSPASLCLGYMGLNLRTSRSLGSLSCSSRTSPRSPGWHSLLWHPRINDEFQQTLQWEWHR